jgi:tetratricopeptide (TPR) repeat protein
VHNLPSWNRVTGVQNLTATALRRSRRAVFFDGCPSVPVANCGGYFVGTSARLAVNFWRPLELIESAFRTRFRPPTCRWPQDAAGSLVPENFPRTQKLPTARQLEQLLESDPDDVFLQYALAKARISEGDVEVGLAQFQAVIDQHPDYVPAYFQKGQALADRGRTDEARAVLIGGINVARKVGDGHAEREMTEFLETLT